MPERQRGTSGYSPKDADRARPRLSGVTVPRDLLSRVKTLAGDERGAMSSAVCEALTMWCETKEKKA